MFRKWFGASRFCYNKTVDLLKSGEVKASWLSIKKSIIKCEEWLATIPYQIQSIAIKDACTAVSRAKMRGKQTGKFNEVKFRSRKNPKQSCYIPKAALSEKGIFSRLSKDLKFTESVDEEHTDARLVFENDRWFVIYGIECNKVTIENQGRVVALDPGIRTFVTYYSQDDCGKIGEQCVERITKLCLQLDKLNSLISKSKCRIKLKFIKKCKRIKWKIHDLVSELHYKTANYLCKNYDVIFLPKFEVSKMTRRISRRLRSKTARAMLTLSHFKFSQILKHKAKEYGKIVVDVNEAYTSKTVSWTGKIVKNQGSKKTITDGHVTLDRDINGARGIFLRAMRDNSRHESV